MEAKLLAAGGELDGPPFVPPIAGPPRPTPKFSDSPPMPRLLLLLLLLPLLLTRTMGSSKRSCVPKFKPPKFSARLEEVVLPRELVMAFAVTPAVAAAAAVLVPEAEVRPSPVKPGAAAWLPGPSAVQLLGREARQCR